MKQDKKQSVEASELRRKAEDSMQTDPAEMQLPRNQAETLRVLHELQIHQIELEMQNAELRQARDEAERALGMYSDLYDFAPVGYLTFDRDGLISAANLTVAKLLGMERSRLTGRRFSSFLGANASSNFITFIDRVFASQSKETCEVALQSGENPPHFARIEAVAKVSGEECRAAVIDISVRRKLEESLQSLHTDLDIHAGKLEVANIDLEAFNYSVSHDLRGPLTVIAGYCDVVEEVYGIKLDEQCHGYFRKIQESTLRMTHSSIPCSTFPVSSVSRCTLKRLI